MMTGYYEIDEFALSVIQKYNVWTLNVVAQAGYYGKKKSTSNTSSGDGCDSPSSTLNNQVNPALHADNVADSCKG